MTAASIDNGDSEELKIAQRWCAERGEGWTLVDKAGEGGTAPVYRLDTPDGPRALKIYNAEFSTGERSRLQAERVELQKKIGDHDCPSLVKIYDGGSYEGRLFVLMSCAPGEELEKVLHEVPRSKIRHIVDQVAKAALFLEKTGFSHRDIKSANVFVDDQFEVVTLLDVSTVRDITDPVGIGTDHGDQLPVVATARYSPPEYLFRLVDPGPDLWRLVDTYQLGALLHDLIMREPMFRAEYEAAKENRYRFAYAVATVTPRVDATDVDSDLVFLARQALVRDWRQRTDLTVNDFLDARKARQNVALTMLGLGGKEKPKRSKQARDLAGLIATGRTVESRVAGGLREQGATAQHHLDPGDDNIRITFSWSPPASLDSTAQIVLAVDLNLTSPNGEDLVQGRATLTGMPGAEGRTADVLLPPLKFTNDCAEEVSASILAALAAAAVKLTNADGENA